LLNVIITDSILALFNLVLYTLVVALFATSVVVLSTYIGVLYALITVTVATVAFIGIFFDTLFDRTSETPNYHE